MSCNCTGGCSSSITSTQGAKGDPGVQGIQGIQGIPGTPGTSYSGVMPIVNASTSTTTLTSSQTSADVILNRASGSAVGLPTAPPIGTYFTFDVLTSAGVGSYVITSNGSDVIAGYITIDKAATNPATYTVATTDNIHNITLNGTTTGGQVGTTITLVYIAANTWYVSGVTVGSGAIATPFS